jgi:hypothetical protein
MSCYATQQCYGRLGGFTRPTCTAPIGALKNMVCQVCQDALEGLIYGSTRLVVSQRKVYVWDRNGRLYDEVHLPTPEEVNAKKVSSQ